MSATTKARNETIRVPNSERNYEVSIYMHFDFFGGTLDFEKLKRSMLEVDCDGDWGESRSSWKWHLNYRRSTLKPFPGDSIYDICHYTIKTACLVKHSQIHAFENFVIDFAERLVKNFPGLKIEAQPIFTSMMFHLGSLHV